MKLLWQILLFSILLTATALAWTDPVEIVHYDAGDARGIAVGKTLHVISTGTPSFYYLSSWNNGFSWTSAFAPCDTFFQGESEGPDIAVDSGGVLHMVWKGLEPPDRNHWKIFHLSSTDGGRNWGPQRQRLFYNNYYVDYPRIVAKGDSLFVICRADFFVLFMRSFDGGLTWRDSTVIDTIGTMGYWPTLLYSNGRINAVYSINAPDDSASIEVFTRYTTDYGLSWSAAVALSTVEQIPQMVASQCPSAYADENGHIIVAWFDYKYGSYCSWSGDILARVSTDNGDSWLPETRLTYTQSGEASNCLIINDTIYVVWMDDLPYGCSYPKIMAATSTDWGISWSNPEIITGPERRIEQSPMIFKSIFKGETYIHCLLNILPSNTGICYMREIPFLTDRLPLPINQDEIFKVKAYQDRLEGKVIISFDNPSVDEVELTIYNIEGRRIWKGDYQGKEGSIIWDARDLAGNSISSGTYFVRATTKENVATTKILYLK